jgi:hypothetical protein
MTLYDQSMNYVKNAGLLRTLDVHTTCKRCPAPQVHQRDQTVVWPERIVFCRAPCRYIAADTELIPQEAFQGMILALRSTLQRELWNKRKIRRNRVK